MVYIVEFLPTKSPRTEVNVSILHAVGVRVNNLVQLWHALRKRSLERRLAAQFTDRDLWDVGLTRGDIHREFIRPFRQTGNSDE